MSDVPAHVVMSLGYDEYVMPAEDALTLVNIIARAERYKENYRSGGNTTYHIWEDDRTASAMMKVISNGHYRIAKCAGKPEST